LLRKKKERKKGKWNKKILASSLPQFLMGVDEDCGLSWNQEGKGKAKGKEEEEEEEEEEQQQQPESCRFPIIFETFEFEVIVCMQGALSQEVRQEELTEGEPPSTVQLKDLSVENIHVTTGVVSQKKKGWA
jgi:hypothetical protein